MRELFLLFGRLGLTSFGGPAAYIATMETEFVDRRGGSPGSSSSTCRTPWLSAFLEEVTVVSLSFILAMAGRLGRETLSGAGPIGIALAGGLAVGLTRINLVWVVLGGALLGGVLLG